MSEADAIPGVESQPPPLGYEVPSASGTVNVYREGNHIDIVIVPEPLHWRVVVRRTMRWMLTVAITAMAGFGAIEGRSDSGGERLVCAIIAAIGCRWMWVLWTIHRRRRMGPPRAHYTAGPDGLSWIDQNWSQPFFLPREMISEVRTHLSPRAIHRVHPVSVVVEGPGGRTYMLCHGPLVQMERVAEHVREGLGINSNSTGIENDVIRASASTTPDHPTCDDIGSYIERQATDPRVTPRSQRHQRPE